MMTGIRSPAASTADWAISTGMNQRVPVLQQDAEGGEDGEDDEEGSREAVAYPDADRAMVMAPS